MSKIKGLLAILMTAALLVLSQGCYWGHGGRHYDGGRHYRGDWGHHDRGDWGGQRHYRGGHHYKR